MVKLKRQCYGHLLGTTDSSEKTLTGKNPGQEEKVSADEMVR